MTFGRWLKQRRKELGITQLELAERLDISPIMLRKLEAGDRRPSRQIASLLADVLRIPADEREAQVRVANDMKKQGPFISAGGVRSVWLRHDLETKMKSNTINEAQGA